MKDQGFSILKRIHSFRYAIAGLETLFKEEHNSRIHLLAALLVIVMGVYLRISFYEWCLVAIAIGLVFAFELMNSAIENLADFVCTEQHKSIKKIKDLAAAAVLVSTGVAVIIGMCIFVPKINIQ